jgi:hypothetical protein
MEENIDFQCNDGITISIPLDLTREMSMVQELEPDVFPFEVPLDSYSSGIVSKLVAFTRKIVEKPEFTIRLSQPTDEFVEVPKMETIGFPTWVIEYLCGIDICEQCKLLDLANFLRFQKMETILSASIGNYICNLTDEVFQDTFHTLYPLTDDFAKEIMKIENDAVRTRSHTHTYADVDVDVDVGTERYTLPAPIKEQCRVNVPVQGPRADILLTKGMCLLSSNLFRQVVSFV